MPQGRHTRLEGMSGEMLRAIYDGASRQYHQQLYDLRAAFAALPHDDPDRDAGIAITDMADISFHTMKHQCDLLASACTAFLTHHPLILVVREDEEGERALGVEVWEPKSPNEQP